MVNYYLLVSCVVMWRFMSGGCGVGRDAMLAQPCCGGRYPGGIGSATSSIWGLDVDGACFRPAEVITTGKVAASVCDWQRALAAMRCHLWTEGSGCCGATTTVSPRSRHHQVHLKGDFVWIKMLFCYLCAIMSLYVNQCDSPSRPSCSSMSVTHHHSSDIFMPDEPARCVLPSRSRLWPVFGRPGTAIGATSCLPPRPRRAEACLGADVPEPSLCLQLVSFTAGVRSSHCSI